MYVAIFDVQSVPLNQLLTTFVVLDTMWYDRNSHLKHPQYVLVIGEIVGQYIAFI